MCAKITRNIEELFIGGCDCQFHKSRKQKSCNLDARQNRYQLYDIDEIPDYNTVRNPHILSGYRCHYTTWQCIKSIFAIHNETLNIWTQIVFLLYDLVILLHEPWDKCETWIDRLILFSGHLSKWAMLLTSIACHVMGGHYCYLVLELFETLDFCGIAVLITGYAIETDYLLLYQHLQHKPSMILHITIIFILGIVVLVVTISGTLCRPEYRIHRTVFYMIWGIILYVIVMNDLVLAESFESPGSPSYDPLEDLYWSAGIIAISPIIYMTRFPEVLFPGKFDIIAHSHQWHHIIVFIYGIYTKKFIDQLRFSRFIEAGLKESLN